MPLNGSGVYTPPAADFPAVAGTVIESAKFNNVINDIASAVSTAIMKDGQSTPTGDIPMATRKITGLGLGTARTDAASLANLQDGTGIFVSSVGGTANAVTLSPAPAITAYVAGQIFYYIATAANTAAVTIAVSGLAAKDLTTYENIALSAGVLQPGLISIVYDGTRFRAESICAFRQSATAGSQSFAQFAAGLVTFDQYLAVGDGSTDDTVNMQKAIDANPGKIIYGVPGKNYRITGPLTITTDHTTLDFRWAALDLSDATGLLSHIKIGFQAGRINANRIINCTFTRAQAATAGAAVETNLTGLTDVVNCRIYGNSRIYYGVKFYRTIGGMVDTMTYIDNTVGAGVHTLGTDLSTNACNDIHIYARWVSGGAYGLIFSDYTQGVYVDLCVMYAHTTADLSCAASSGAGAGTSFKFRNSDFDSSLIGVYAEYHDAIQINSCWFSNFTNTGLIVKQTATNIVITGNQVYPSGTAVGFELGGTDMLCANNNFGGGGSQVLVKSTAVATQITGNHFTSGQYGVNMAENPATCNVVGNMFRSQSIAPMTDAGSPTNRYIKSNDGDTVVGVTTSLAVTASPMTITCPGRPCHYYVASGTVSQIAIGGIGAQFNTGVDFHLDPYKTAVMTYSSAPLLLQQFK